MCRSPFWLVLWLAFPCWSMANWVEYATPARDSFITIRSDSSFDFGDFLSSPPRTITKGKWIASGDTLVLNSYADTRLSKQAPPGYEIWTSFRDRRFLRAKNGLTPLGVAATRYRLLETWDSAEAARAALRERTGMVAVVSPALTLQGQWTGEINAFYGKSESNTGGVGSGFWGPRIGFETSLSGAHRSYVAKLGLSADAVPFCVRLSALARSQSGRTDYKLLPEIGLSLLIANLMYGYEIHTFGARVSGPSNHRFSLTVSYGWDLYRDKRPPPSSPAP